VVTPRPPAIYVCRVHHVRGEPLRHSFSYRTWLWLVDLDHLPELPRPFRPLARFCSRDHLGRADLPIRANVERFAAGHGVDLAGGRVVMLAHARSLGYVFNSLSVFWCYDASGALACVLAEIHNTYGGRHCYLLRPSGFGQHEAPATKAGGESTCAAQRGSVAKDMYVSPFYGAEGHYRMRLPEPAGRLALTVCLHPPGGRPFVATLRGERRSGTATGLLRAWAGQPCPALVAATRIRVQAIQLRLRGLPVVPRPAHPPQDGVW
jgi:uncharacterized protein